MEVLGLASMVPVTFRTRFQGVSRTLNELNEEDKYSVIYEIARIETMLSRIADNDGPFCPI
ncbi:hypothetical protein KF707_17635 [Candidatus Obscuribacterales bacterium]|jgi:hypothetical protein|nr:hypothetical protein [Candidatus Obscuribacterales bacterium]MBX3138054.1 hypothetical protein [Candidatus Obscuribacterales bacterium]MBX3151202.1 hypothetical protein [Candidatus Obscuribacterales bacterium]